MPVDQTLCQLSVLNGCIHLTYSPSLSAEVSQSGGQGCVWQSQPLSIPSPAFPGQNCRTLWLTLVYHPGAFPSWKLILSDTSDPLTKAGQYCIVAWLGQTGCHPVGGYRYKNSSLCEIDPSHVQPIPPSFWPALVNVFDNPVDCTTPQPIPGTGTGTVLPPPPPPPPQPHNSLFFNGTNYVDMGNPAILNITGPITLSAWFNLSAIGNFGNRIVSKYNTNHGYDISVLQNGEVQFTLCDGVSQYPLTSGLEISLNTLYHVVATYDGTTMNLYLNNVLVNTTTGPASIVSSSGDFLTATFSEKSVLTVGTIDAIRVYTTSLTASQVAEIYGAGLGLGTAGSASANLVGWWKFDERSGHTAIDSSSQGNNGTEVNGPVYTPATILG